QKLTLNEDYVVPPARPRWASLSPDEQTVVFARNHNLYVMDAANFAKAQKNGADTSIVETKLTTDGEEFYSYARSRQQDQQILEQQQQQQQQQQRQQDQQDQPGPAAQTQTATTTTAAAGPAGSAGQAGPEPAAGHDDGRQERARAGRQRHLVAGLEAPGAHPPRRAQGEGPLGHQRTVEPAPDARDL